MIGNKLGSIMMRNVRPMLRPFAAQGAKRNLNVHEYVRQSKKTYLLIQFIYTNNKYFYSPRFPWM